MMGGDVVRLVLFDAQLGCGHRVTKTVRPETAVSMLNRTRRVFCPACRWPVSYLTAQVLPTAVLSSERVETWKK